MASWPSPPVTPTNVPVRPQIIEQVVIRCLPINKICKSGAEEFLELYNYDPAMVEYWLLNSQRDFDELHCSPEESLKCVVSLLKEYAYQ